MQAPKQASNPQNPSLTELKLLRQEFAALREEVAGFRSDLGKRKAPNITDQVAKGVVIALFFWLVVVVFLNGFLSVLG